MTPDRRPDAGRLARFTVGDWVVDPRACQASRGEAVEKLRPQLTDLLVCLATRPGKIVLKSEILADVWPGQFIADSGLSRCIAELRQILQDEAQQPHYIETIPKRGYRLIAPVRWLEEEPDSAAGALSASAPPTPATDVPPAAAVASADPVPPGTATQQSPASAPAVPARGRRARPWFGAAAAVLVAGFAGVVFLATRSPARVLTGRDTVLLADVKNSTSDPVFDDALRLALAVNLEQAPFLRILPQDAVRSALVRAGRSPDERVFGPLALEVCRREGAAVLLAGSIASLGSRYAVGIEAIACETGESVGHALEEAATRERVLPALEQAATRIRQRLGESRESLRQHGVPLVQATTPSLEALRALTLGDVHRNAGRHEEALPYYRQATDLDPAFALAWARRGVTARNIGLRQEAIPALRRAFELAGRVSQPERFFIEALYYRLVEGDQQKSLDTLRAWRAMYPGSPIPANAIASTLSDEMGDYEAAVNEARDAIRLAPNNGMPYNNLAQALVATGQVAEARKVVDEAARRGIDDWTSHLWLWIAAQSEGDQAAMAREYQWATRPPSLPTSWLLTRAQVLAGQGRLAEARRAWSDALVEAGRTGSGADAAMVHADRAEGEALVGDRAAARMAVDAALAADAGPFNRVRAALATALLGDTSRARAVLDDAARAAQTDPAPLKVLVPSVEALIASREGRGDEARRLLLPIARYEKGGSYGLSPLGIRGVAAAAAGRPAEAVEAFGELVRLRAVAFGPWVAVARLGQARAFRDAGDTQRSLAAYDAFLEWWENADQVPLLKAAQQERKALAARR
jgi:eukaryotic-like serine/threonine-protein kinase